MNGPAQGEGGEGASGPLPVEASVQDVPGLERAAPVYRWDLDKTYLRTDFDTLRDLFRTALEPAERKRTLPGAGALLRALRASGPAGVYILSGSPEQMRRVLEAKLRLDGIDWDGFVLKPSLHNLLRGRLRFVRDQVSYKLTALLRSRLEETEGQPEVLFGDDAEADAFVYSLYADLCAGRVAGETLREILVRSRAYEDHLDELLHLAERLPRRACVRRIFIHLERVEPASAFDYFGSRVCAFHNYFQPALVLVQEGLLAPEAALRIGVELVEEHAFSPQALAASFGDLVERALLDQATVARLSAALPALGNQRTQLAGDALALLGSAMGSHVVPLAVHCDAPAFELDYPALLGADRRRATDARRRHRARHG